MIELAFRLLLAGVLGGAALAKVASPASSQASLATFGFGPGSLRRAAWVTLVATELGLAVAVAAGSAGAAYAAAALMGMFALLLVGALMRGRAGAPCACFGARSRVSVSAVLRNLALAAGFAVLPSLPQAQLSTDDWLTLGLAIALVACAGLAVALLALAREVGMLRLQVGAQGALEIAGEGPDLGDASPALAAPLESPARLALAIFSSPGCHLCRTLEPSIESMRGEPGMAVRVFDEVEDAEIWRALEIPGSPYAIAHEADGTVLAKGTFNNLAQLESVAATAERRRAGERSLGREVSLDA
jgi:Methylamine utilisation protein MauE